MWPQYQFYLEAFMWLSSNRNISDNNINYIPWDKMVLYSKWKELDYENECIFMRLIHSLDMVYVKNFRDEQKKAREASKAKGKRPPPRGARKR